ncbi:MAG TPA: class I SAM-dependent rRNA methyltransferase [bacterium]|nr:class I SAM-dependent rRNA methyltransferase [bacterium]
MVLRPGREARLRAGHLWVYRGEIARVLGDPRDGDAVTVHDAGGRHLGAGFINTRSLITVRLLTADDRDLDEAFFRERLERAAAFRRDVVVDTAAYRLVFGESDLLPGLVVDRYAGTLVVQTLTAGMDRRKTMLARLLLEVTGAASVYARNDPAVRRLEGLPRERGWLAGAPSRGAPGGMTATGGPIDVVIEEAGATFVVDIAGGQKTGFFLDQRENRVYAAGLVRGEVLDVFAYTGAWAVHAARRGAEVTAVEISDPAAAAIARHAALNGVGARCRAVTANAFDELRRLDRGRARFDAVILDPPAFVKTRAALERGLAGYKEINLRALKILRPGGWLVTCSCSYHVDEAALEAVVQDAARDAGRWVRLVERRAQARDHPVSLGVPETRYLKCLILEVE